MRNELESDNGKAQSTTGNEGKRLCVIIWNYFVYSQFAIKSFLQKALTVVHMHDWMWKSEKKKTDVESGMGELSPVTARTSFQVKRSWSELKMR